jgi:hypothetical protein
VTTPLFATLLAMGNPMAWPWHQPSGPHLAPSAGYWVAVAALGFALAALLLLVVQRALMPPESARTQPVIS